MNTTETKPESTLGKTPSEIIHHHLQHPEEPVTGEEIRYAKITEAPTDLPLENKTDMQKEIKAEEKDKDERTFPISSPYEVLGK